MGLIGFGVFLLFASLCVMVAVGVLAVRADSTVWLFLLLLVMCGALVTDTYLLDAILTALRARG
jgi:hypothetical protein